jgi:hypothetical protein
MRAIVFPVGHYTGVVPAAIGAPHHVIRVGLEQHKLADEDFGLWMIAHGPVESSSTPWTRNLVLAQAREAGVADPANRLTELAQRGLVVEVEPAAAAGFAHAYRLHPLLIGLGDVPERPGYQRIGVPETGPVATLDPDSYELWQWAATTPTLWASCELRGVDDVLRDLRVLIQHGCAYLDPVR